MKKKAILLSATLLALALTGCGSSSTGGSTVETISVDTTALAEALLDTITSDSLTETASSLIASTYLLDDENIESSVAYASSGATACAILVVESKETDNVSDVEASLSTFVENQASLYATYNQSEATRLDAAIIKSTGVYTVLCVCDDTEAAESVLSEYGF